MQPTGCDAVEATGGSHDMQLAAKNIQERLCDLVTRMISRGPDGVGFFGNSRFGMAHVRLAIMDPQHGQQPLVRSYDNKGYACVINGEIYNHRALQEEHNLPAPVSSSDSEVIIQLYHKFGPAGVCDKLNGIFGFVVSSEDGSTCMAARDHCGIKPLYMATSPGGRVWFASELKTIVDQGCEEYMEFPDGHYWTREDGFVKYYNPDWDDESYVHEGGTAKHG